MTTERVLQKKIIEYFKKLSIIAVKTDSTSVRGWPDLVAVLPTGEVHFIEIKTPTGRLSIHQERIHEQLTKQGANIHVIRSLDEAKALFPSDP